MAMRFRFLDRIEELEPGVRITAIKELRAEEDYLCDHFPEFPVMPGVLMLEALYQAGMWLLRESEGFSTSVVMMKEVRNVKYADFVEPGQTLRVTAEIQKERGNLITVKAQGTVNDSVAVSGRLILEKFNLKDRYPEQAPFDPYICKRMRTEFERVKSGTMD